jgi:hypothetical protein
MSLGVYKDTNQWGSGTTGLYVGLGGNDQYPTEYYALTYGGFLRHSSGEIKMPSTSLLNGTAANPSIFFRSSTTTGFYRYADGDIGVSSKGVFEFLFDGGAGNFHAKNDVIAYSSTFSDSRLKKNINNMKGSLDMIKQLNPVTFEWEYMDEKNMYGQDSVHGGFVAQELMQVLPNVVHSTKLPFHSDEKKRLEKYYVIRYQELIPYAVSAIKELAESTDEKIKRLEGRIVELEKLTDRR